MISKVALDNPIGFNYQKNITESITNQSHIANKNLDTMSFKSEGNSSHSGFASFLKSYGFLIGTLLTGVYCLAEGGFTVYENWKSLSDMMAHEGFSNMKGGKETLIGAALFFGSALLISGVAEGNKIARQNGEDN